MKALIRKNNVSFGLMEWWWQPFSDLESRNNLNQNMQLKWIMTSNFFLVFTNRIKPY